MVRLRPQTLGLRPLAALVGMLLGLSSSGEALAQEAFPYIAYVHHADSYVRSGPGQRYYPTQQMPQGFAVEVYRHDQGGWCAIRPPEGSFSWVAAHEVRLVEPNVAEVIAEQTVTRVGSVLSPTRSAVQVLLKKGERVAVAAGKLADDPNWLRVVPPAGEFRWIAARDLGRQAPLEVTPPTPANGIWSRSQGFVSPTQPLTESTTASAQNGFDHLQQTPESGSLPTQDVSQPTMTSDGGRVDIVAGSPADLQLAQFQGQSSPVATPEQNNASAPLSVNESTSPRIRFGGKSVSAASINQEEIPEWVKEIELRLSQMVAEPPATWQFDQLRLEANSMMKQADSPAVRTQLGDLLDRLSSFQQVRDGYGQIAQTPAPREEFPVPELGEPVDPIANIVKDVRQRVREDFARLNGEASEKEAPTIDKPLYDAVGLLKPVVSRRSNAPQYALVDSKGDVVSFVTPTPDLNLMPYVGRRIGVNGTRGFMTDFQRAHVTAGRVTPIETTLRR
jgi:hypothetical protein